jgi:adenylate cyclase
VLHRDSEGVNFLNLQSEDQKKQFIRDTLDGPNGTGSFVKNLAATLAEAPDPDFQKSLDSVKAADANLRLVNEQNERLEEQLQQFRTELYAKLHGHAIFFGGTATGLLDLRPTSLIGECPGVVIHGAIYNAVLTGKIPRVVDPDIDHAITAVIGIFTLLIVLRLAPLFAFIASLTLALGYLAFNGYFLFAYKNLIVSAAGPIVAIGLVWSVVTLTNILTEIAEKSRITRRFRNYVDPSLVDWVVDHPDNVRFDGERREMTVCFSDLVGFTTLTDELGERVVPLLAEYMGKMVPVIRSHNGYVAQLIGDGIYFFFGAPQTNQSHAEHAVQTALGMHKALEHFNITLRERSSKMLGMRIGISTGEVVIGDAGTADASAYTAMGATTNLASRLESANKVFGTHTLITARTVELLNGDYLVRPIANVRVAGKLNSVVVYEPLGLKSECTEQDRALVDCTTKIFQAYRNADFIGCITACADMDQLFGSSKLTKLYTHLSNEHVTTSATDFCEGQIVLTEK